MSIVRFNYCCKNDSCSVAWKTVQVEKDKDLEDEVELCDVCEEELKQLGFIAAGGYLASSAMSLERKKEVLKKRSHEHFVKSGIQDRKNTMIRTMKTNNLDTGDFKNSKH